MGTPTAADVDLCLRLYEQRRDPALREARDWMSAFLPNSFEDIKKVMTGEAGKDANRYWRQAGSYWEMIAGIMMSGAVSLEGRLLFAQTTKEFAFHFSKIEPFLAEIRAFARPTAFAQLEAFIDSLPDRAEFMGYFRTVGERQRAMAAVAKKPAKTSAKKAAPKPAAKHGAGAKKKR